jgi:hypothetical protein
MPTYTIPTKSYIDSQDALKTNAADLLMAIGNINSPLLDMPLKNSLAMKSGVGSATFTRASTATYIDRYDVLKTAAIDEPRFEKEGYLNEGVSTNRVAYSEDFSDARWIKTNTTVSANTAETTDPCGTNLADKVSFTSTTGSIAQLITLAGTSYSYSIFVKKGVGDYITLRTVSYDTNLLMGFNLTTLTPQSSLGSIEELSDGWLRLSVSSSLIGTDLTGAIYVYSPSTLGGTDAVSGNYHYLFGAQLEALPFASSYIQTVDSTVTRSADVLNVTRAGNVPNVEVNGEISAVFDIDTHGTSGGNQWVWGLYSASNNNVGFYLSPALKLQSTANSATDANSATGGLAVAKTTARIAQTINNTSNIVYKDGAFVASDVDTDNRITDTQNSALSTLRIGSYNPSNVVSITMFFGHISNFRIYDRPLTAQEVALA